MLITSEYFKEYRQKLGFSNQNSVKYFFAAKDITPTVDYTYIGLLNNRLVDIVRKIDSIVSSELKMANEKSFFDENIYTVFEKLKNNNILPKLNNQGRRPEEVYFSWMRGFVVSNYFLTSLGLIFGVKRNSIELIGDDDLVNIETFKRTPKADLRMTLADGKKVRIEVQSGFQGINDIKQHKVLEAKKIKLETNEESIVVHFDLFNGQVAFVKIDNIEDESVNWITRQQMEGQTVFNIDQNYFVWKLTQMPPKFETMIFE